MISLLRLDAHAMTTHTVPRKVEGLGAYYPGNDFGRSVDLSMSSYVCHEWHGVNGTTMVSNHDSPTVANTKGSMLFMVPTNRAAFDYKDCLDIYFEDVGVFQGRVLNARLHFNSIKYGPYTPNGKYQVSYSSSPTGVFLLQPCSGPELFFGRSDQQEWFPGLEQRYDAVKDITITLTVTYADTGAVVEFPFYQYVNDIDDNNLWNTYGAQEGVTFGSGFTDDLYVYDGFRCSVNGRTVKVPNDGKNHNWSDFYVPPPTPGATSGEHKSNEPKVKEAGWFLNACWGVTNNGQFTTTFHGSNAVASMNVRSPYLSSSIIKKPRKTGSTSSQNPESMFWEISVYLPNLTDELLKTFRTLTIKDVLPSGQTYVRAEIRDKDSNVISSQGSMSYNSSTRLFSVSMNSSFLSNKANYGHWFTVRIYCNWNSGVTSAQNTALVTIDGGPDIPTDIPTVTKPAKSGVNLWKTVLNPKEVYGPGDEVEFLVILDTESYEKYTRDKNEQVVRNFIPNKCYDEDLVYTRDNLVLGFSWEDTIPDGLELIGEPVFKRDSQGVRYASVNEFNKSGSTPVSLDDYSNFWTNALQKGRFMGSGERGIAGVGVTTAGEHTYQPLADAVSVVGPCGFLPISKFCADFDDAVNGDYAYVHNKVIKEGGRVFVSPSNLFKDYGMDVSFDKRHISIKAKDYMMFSAFRHMKTYPEGDIHFLCMYYKCRVTGSVQNSDVINTTNVSFRPAAVIDGDIYGSISTGTRHLESYAILLDSGITLSAQSAATVYLGGYQVTTEVVNGSIDDDMYNLPPGANISVAYVRDSGYYLKSIEVDGVSQPLSPNESFYRFSNLNSSHHIKVVYEKGHDITTEAVHGLIDAAYTGIRPGESRTIHYEPEDGYMLSTITVDGNPVTTVGNLSSYLFSNVQANHHIKVVFIPQYKITTSIEHGTITPTVTKIPPGESRSITYSPDSGYYVKSVTVDGAALGVADLKAHLGSYTFSNIQKDHTIHVVCVPYPVITIKKQINGNHVILAKGVPAFTYKIEGDDYLGNHHVYHRELSWPRSNSIAESKSVTLKIPPGRYTITELSSNDWSLQSVQAGTNASVSGKTIVVDTRNASAADGTFVNDVSDWSKYTENDVEVNRLK